MRVKKIGNLTYYRNMTPAEYAARTRELGEGARLGPIATPSAIRVGASCTTTITDPSASRPDDDRPADAPSS